MKLVTYRNLPEPRDRVGVLSPEADSVIDLSERVLENRRVQP